jgi:hypothetical protein
MPRERSDAQGRDIAFSSFHDPEANLRTPVAARHRASVQSACV